MKSIAYTTSAIMSREDSIVFITHDEDGEWQFFPDKDFAMDEVMMVTVDQVKAIDPGIEAALSIPTGTRVMRANGNEWTAVPE
jgi:hypothetical protein